MFCRHCGNKLIEGAKFCKHCGHEVGQIQMPPSVTEQIGGSPQGQQHMNPVSQPVMSQG